MKKHEQKPEPPPLRTPEVRYIAGQRVYKCVACQDCGYRYVLVELPDKRKASAMTPCFCDFGSDCQRALEWSSADEFNRHRVHAKELGPLPFSPYTGGIDPNDPRIPSNNR